MSDEHTITGKIRPYEEDCYSVTRFSKMMTAKMQKNAYKGHWVTVSEWYLLRRAFEEIIELMMAMIKRRLGKATRHDVQSECCDVANFCMMISDNFERVEI